MTFLPAYSLEQASDSDDICILTGGSGRSRTLVIGTNNPGSYIFPLLSDLGNPGAGLPNLHEIGRLDEIRCCTAEIPGDFPIPRGFELIELRTLYGLFPEPALSAVSRAVMVLQFHKAVKFCSRCGTVMEGSSKELLKTCPSCRYLSYPRISPAVIVLIRKKNAVLLAHNIHFPENLYSCIAGFVDPGENLEEAVQREIREEVGIEVRNITYFGSQPWPFPNSLMLGFTADYASGIITPDNVEITDAGWFTGDAMPDLPMGGSISRHLIDSFLNEVQF